MNKAVQIILANVENGTIEFNDNESFGYVYVNLKAKSIAEQILATGYRDIIGLQENTKIAKVLYNTKLYQALK